MDRSAGAWSRYTTPVAKIALAEGIESAMSFTQLTKIPCWAGLGGNLDGVVLLPQFKEVVLAVDGDDAGDEYARKLGPRLAREGRKVRIAQPHAGRTGTTYYEGNPMAKVVDIDARKQAEKILNEAPLVGPDDDLAAEGEAQTPTEYNDINLSRLFADQYKDTLRYVDQLGCW